MAISALAYAGTSAGPPLVGGGRHRDGRRPAGRAPRHRRALATVLAARHGRVEAPGVLGRLRLARGGFHALERGHGRGQVGKRGPSGGRYPDRAVLGPRGRRFLHDRQGRRAADRPHEGRPRRCRPLRQRHRRPGPRPPGRAHRGTRLPRGRPPDRPGPGTSPGGQPGVVRARRRWRPTTCPGRRRQVVVSSTSPALVRPVSPATSPTLCWRGASLTRRRCGRDATTTPPPVSPSLARATRAGCRSGTPTRWLRCLAPPYHPPFAPAEGAA